MKTVALVPSYNHYTRLPALLQSLAAQGLDVLIIDDGSEEPAKTALANHQDPEQGVSVLRSPINGGKGSAVTLGMRAASERGYSHAVQIDADGQHDASAIPSLLAASTAHPDAVITGVPIFDET